MPRFIVVLSMIAFVFLVLPDRFSARGQRPEPPMQQNQEMRPIAPPPARQTPRAQRHREGTKFKDMHVFFRSTGDRTVLYTVGENQRFTCHENLELERILTVLQAKPEREFWKIEGEFTEFCGENFVLIRRAVVAQAPSETVPIAP